MLHCQQNCIQMASALSSFVGAKSVVFSEPQLLKRKVKAERDFNQGLSADQRTARVGLLRLRPDFRIQVSSRKQ